MATCVQEGVLRVQVPSKKVKLKLPPTDDRVIGDIVNSSPRELGLAFAIHTTFSCLTVVMEVYIAW